MNIFDIVIQGGGIAGSALALALKDSGLRIALIEAETKGVAMHDLAEQVADITPRVSALSLASQYKLQHWGVWPLLNMQRCCFYKNMYVWDVLGNAALEFSADEVQKTQLGCIVENVNLLEALQTALSTAAHITIWQPKKLHHVEHSVAAGWSLQLDDGQMLHAQLLIAADGANSFVREYLQLPVRAWDYPHQAIVATVKTQKPHQFAARQCFMPSGPLAFLPLQSQDQCLSSIVWSLVPERAQQLSTLSDKQFKLELEDAFEHRLGRILDVSQRYIFPLRQQHALDYVQQGLALIADAAHTIHPLAGQGINLGLEDVAVLADEILGAVRRGVSWSSTANLQRYQRRRKLHNLNTMAAMEVFVRLFAQQRPDVVWLRNEGMRLFSKVQPLKKYFISRAMGI